MLGHSLKWQLHFKLKMTAAWIKLIHLICTVYCHNNPPHWKTKKINCKTVLEKNGLTVEIKNIKNIYSQGGALDAFLYS